ncbi:T9SS type A sorting domain-containing protein [Algibacter mikhailovii]|uniref:T9SS C-terminal target domain-containing protein n=1 Tax=Algibacter mikhailovii TaxID=425498 RepID=A0A918VB64_9FLAO|nr:T9SS type A sorting domain-containing protein [Algibacter mikhailovii]GGZ85061.1 T9SS C-terminal target domain-containing protein [Algibacter mikhailovii]
MLRKFFLFLITVIAFFSVQINGAQNRGLQEGFDQNIQGLTIYPNPAYSSGKLIYITSERNALKHIEFYDVLGKRIFNTKITGRELDISNLKKGVYIIKVTENTKSETRKLVIR